MTEHLTLGQASRRYVVSRSTLHRAVTTGKIPTAEFDSEAGEWRIPIEALEAEYELRDESATPPNPTAEIAALTAEVDTLRTMLEVRAEQVADLRAQVADLRANVEDLRALPPASAPPELEPVDIAAAVETAVAARLEALERRRRWWKR